MTNIYFDATDGGRSGFTGRKGIARDGPFMFKFRAGVKQNKYVRFVLEQEVLHVGVEEVGFVTNTAIDVKESKSCGTSGKEERRGGRGGGE